MTKLEKIAPFALDIVIVIALTVLAGIGRLDALVVVGILGPMLGARVAGAAKKTSKSGDDKDGPSLPPSAILLLLAGASRLLTRSSA